MSALPGRCCLAKERRPAPLFGLGMSPFTCARWGATHDLKSRERYLSSRGRLCERRCPRRFVQMGKEVYPLHNRTASPKLRYIAATLIRCYVRSSASTASIGAIAVPSSSDTLGAPIPGGGCEQARPPSRCVEVPYVLPARPLSSPMGSASPGRQRGRWLALRGLWGAARFSRGEPAQSVLSRGPCGVPSPSRPSQPRATARGLLPSVSPALRRLPPLAIAAT